MAAAPHIDPKPANQNPKPGGAKRKAQAGKPVREIPHLSSDLPLPPAPSVAVQVACTGAAAPCSYPAVETAPQTDRPRPAAREASSRRCGTATWRSSCPRSTLSTRSTQAGCRGRSRRLSWQQRCRGGANGRQQQDGGSSAGWLLRSIQPQAPNAHATCSAPPFSALVTVLLTSAFPPPRCR